MKPIRSCTCMLILSTLPGLVTASENAPPPSTVFSLGALFQDASKRPKFDGSLKYIRFIRGNTTLETFSQCQHATRPSFDSLGNLRGRYYLITGKTPWLGDYQGYFASGAVRWRGGADPNSGSYFGLGLSRRIGATAIVDFSYQHTSYFDDGGLNLYTVSLGMHF